VPTVTVDRRRFLTSVGAGAASLAAFPVVEGWRTDAARVLAQPQTAPLIRLDKNENPAGPFPSARRAITEAMAEAGRYPGGAAAGLTTALARAHGVGENQIVLGCGSTEILRLCTERFTTSTRGLVAAHPTFEDPAFVAGRLGRPVKSVPVTRSLALDLDAMAVAARGAGLVFLCNPNNPTSTVHGAAAVRDFIARVRRTSPDTMILVDEAYHEYVDDPSYATMMPEIRDPHIIVARTFSKVYGMAGVRVGYAVAAPDTANALAERKLDSAVNQFAVAGAVASLRDTAAMQAEQRRNRTVRGRVMQWFAGRGFTAAPSQTNFVFVGIKRDVRPVIAACLDRGVAVGRPFPPLETHLRLSIGTQAEIDKALEVLGSVLT
jgi:histidinol-phosphate aminotransferase